MKCCVLDFVTKHSIQFSAVCRFPSLHLKQVSEFRFLGVVVSSDFKWNSHFEYVLQKASRRLFVLSNLKRSGCPSFFLLKSYTGFIRPLLTYAFPSFCNAPSYLMNRILSFEKRAFRIMGLTHSHHLSILDISDKQCSNLFKSIESSTNHPCTS